MTGNATVSVFHLGNGGRSFEHRPVGPNSYYQWCDGVAVSADRVIGFGQFALQNTGSAS